MRKHIKLLTLASTCGLILALLSAGDRALAEKNKKEEVLITSGVTLEKVLIGKQPKKSGVTLDTTGKFDGVLHLVIDSPYQIYAAMGTYIHVAAFTPDFEPAADAQVFLDDKIVGRTDKTGTIVFAVATNEGGGYNNKHNVDVVSKSGGKRYRGSVYFNAYPRTQGFTSSHIFVYTDRGIYNPGQTIRIRAVAWSLTDDFAPLESKSVDLFLKDESGRVVAGGGVETDAWGIASFEIPLPEHAPEGRYYLEASHDRETAKAKLRIERFVPPVIDIQHDLGRFLSKDKKTLPVKITLGMFGGGTFTEGTLKVKVESRSEVKFDKKIEVEGAGPHEVIIDEKAVEKITAGLGEDENVRVTITVTDEFGRTDEIKRDMRYTANPYRVVVEMDKDQYSEGDTVRAMVRVVDLDEVPIRDKKVKLVVDGKSHWAETDDGGIAKFELKMDKNTITGQVYLEDVDQSLATMYAYYHPPRPMTSEIPEGVVKEQADTEIVVRFPTDFVPVEKVVHADIVDQSGALIGAALIPIEKKKGKYIAKGTFPAPAWGSMLLTMFCLGRQGKDGKIGLLTEGQNLPVKADRELEITMKGIPDKASPGQKLGIDAVVTDKDGKVVSAAVGASVVDQAVLGMLDPLEITPMDRFYHPQLKVLSTAGSKILTWPVVSRNWGYATYDIALPPFGFREGGPSTQAHIVDKKANKQAKVKGKKGKKGKKYKKKDKSKKPPSDPGPDQMFDYDEDMDGAFGYGGLGLSGTGSGGGGVGYGYGIGSVGASAKGAAAPVATAAPSSGMNKMSEMLDVPMGGEVDALMSSLEAGASSLALGAATPTGPAGKVRISVRTNFAETSLWAPDLVAKKGKLSFDAQLPDSITTQTVTLIASDKDGRVGMVREQIDVSQEMYARSDLPATLTLGDTVEVTSAVRNFGKAQIKATIGIKSDGLKIVGKPKKSVTVPVGGTGAAAFTVKPLKAGKVEYEVWTEGGGVKDIERRTIWVEPAGMPTVIRAKGKVEKGEPFEAKVHLSGNDTHAVAMLNVAFPNAVPAIQGLESMVGQPGGAIDFISSGALTTAMIYQYLIKNGSNEAALSSLKLELTGYMAALMMSQNPDGGWGWHVKLLRSDADGTNKVDVPVSNPYMTAQTLEGLVEMKKAGLPVPETAVRSGLYSLVGSMGSDGLWSVDDIAFWEGKTNEVQLGISAEIFRVMAMACQAFPNLAGESGIVAPMDKLAVQLRPLLIDGNMRDPMALSHSALGVWTWAKLRSSVDKNLEADLAVAAKRLVTLRDEAYWEPSWFNAFGGTIEATAASMELLVALDAEKFELELRRSLDYILSTQESFGAWHNARGTAAAIRALLLVAPTKKEIPSTVKVSVNGKVVREVDIDPDDPFMSAVSLRMVELTPYLGKGDNEVKVTYDGNLEAPVKLTLSKWGEVHPDGSAMPGAPSVKVARQLEDLSDDKGALVEVTLRVKFQKHAVPVTITEPIPSNADVETESLDALMASGDILGYDLLSNEIVFYPVPGAKKLKLTYRLAGERKGTAVQPGTVVAPLSNPLLEVSGNTTELRVK